MRAVLSLLSAAGLCLAAGCGPGVPGDPGRRLVVWEMEDAAVAPYIDSVFKAFRALPGHADLEIVRTHYHPEDLRQQFQTASIAGNPPDLIISQSDPAGIYSVSGFIQPVDGLFDLKRYNKAAVGAVSQGGKTWGVPISNGNHLMFFYNKKFAPQPPRTTDELFAFCDGKAKSLPIDHCMAFFLAEPYWLVPWLGAFGGWPMDGRAPTLDTPAARQAVAFVLDLKRRRYVPQECDYNCADALLMEKKVAFVIGGDWAMSRYQSQLKGDLGVAMIPRLSRTGKRPTPMVSGAYFMLSSKLQGPKLELARQLVEFYINDENQISQARTLLRLPALSKVNKAKVIMDDPNLRASMEQLLVGRPMPMAAEMRAVWDAIRPLYGRVLSGQMGVDEAVSRMQKDAETKILEMNE